MAARPKGETLSNYCRLFFELPSIQPRSAKKLVDLAKSERIGPSKNSDVSASLGVANLAL
jgi:hypothetical protein